MPVFTFVLFMVQNVFRGDFFELTMCVHDGFGAGGLPTGIQFTGRAWGEARLLALAEAYQQATGWHKKHPPDRP